MPWGGYAEATTRHTTLRLDKVRWPSPLASINIGGEPKIRREEKGKQNRGIF
jgi:hypothetical protein